MARRLSASYYVWLTHEPGLHLALTAQDGTRHLRGPNPGGPRRARGHLGYAEVHWSSAYLLTSANSRTASASDGSASASRRAMSASLPSTPSLQATCESLTDKAAMPSSM